MTNLKKLADLKLKLDLVTELYEKEEAEIKKQMLENKLSSIEDKENKLEVKLISTTRRNFSVTGVKDTLKDKAELVLETTVSAKKFDAFTKDMPESDLKKCFNTTESSYVKFTDSFKIYKAVLMERLTSKGE